MKIIYLRHTESIDDLTQQMGGWTDLGLSPHGKRQASAAIDSLSKQGIMIDTIFHSPLLRAKEVAYILGSGLHSPVEEFVWLKEKNGYGLLSGMEKEEAQKRYPDLYRMMEEGYVYGSEPEALFIERVVKCHELLTAMNKNILAVTHGGFISRLLNNVFQVKCIKTHDAGYLIYDTETKTIEAISGIDVE